MLSVFLTEKLHIQAVWELEAHCIHIDEIEVVGVFGVDQVQSVVEDVVLFQVSPNQLVERLHISLVERKQNLLQIGVAVDFNVAPLTIL